MNEKKSTIITLGVIIAVLVMAALVTLWVQRNAEREASLIDNADALIASEATPYTDLEGNPFSFTQFQGKVRVVNSWASWCPFCVKELTDFEQLASEFAADDVVVIAINRKESKEQARKFLNTLGSFEKTVFVVDITDAFYKTIGGFSMPETVFYDSKGNIIVHKRGVMSLEEMREHTQAAITASQEE